MISTFESSAFSPRNKTIKMAFLRTGVPSGRRSSAPRVANTAVTHGLKEAALAEGAVVAAHGVGHLAASKQRHAVSWRRRPLDFGAELVLYKMHGR